MTDRIKLCLRGRMLEKFVGCALREDICFECIERSDGREMILTASERDAARLLAMAEEYQMDMTVIGAEGRPLWRKYIKKRWSLSLGIGLCVVLIVLFTSRIWRVEAVSLDGMTDTQTLDAIERYVQEWGIGIGALRESVNRDALARDIQLQWGELTHVSVRVRGVYLQIEVAQEDGAPNLYDVSDSRDLVALRDAVVVYVQPLAGKARVKTGDTVRRGQLLIQGEERTDGATRRIRALGTVTARVWYEAECTLPMQQSIREYTGNVNISAQLRLGDWSWTLSQAEDYFCQEVTEEYLPVGGLYLPVKIVRTIRREYQEKSVPIQMEKLKAQGEAWALELAREKLPREAQESGYWTEFVVKDNILTVHVTVEAQMNIAVERSALESE